MTVGFVILATTLWLTASFAVGWLLSEWIEYRLNNRSIWTRVLGPHG